MALILNIDTAVQSASVCLSENENPIAEKINPEQKDQASWMHPAIETLLKEKNYTLEQVNAIAVSAGPGSYTGLRVGMSSAKGFCYALQIPLITINTLQMMTTAAMDVSADFFCPMIDARRMEVFTALFDRELHEILPSANKILDEHSFGELLEKHRICFFGNGSQKFKSLICHPNAIFSDAEATATNMCKLSYRKFLAGDFANLAYSEPFYGKDFHSSIK